MRIKTVAFLFFVFVGLSANLFADAKAENKDTDKEMEKKWQKIYEGVIPHDPNSMCDWAKKEGAGTLDWWKIEASDLRFTKARWDYGFWKQDHLEEQDKCYEMGRKYGDLTYDEMVDKKAKALLSKDEYEKWIMKRKIEKLRF